MKQSVRQNQLIDSLNLNRSIADQSLNTVQEEQFKGQFEPKNYIQYCQCPVTERDIELYKEVFDMLCSSDGIMTPKDLRLAMERYGGYNPKRQLVYQIFSEFDKDSSGEIEFREFLQMMTSKPCEKDTPQDIEKVFLNIDQAGKGHISIQDLMDLAADNSEQLTEEDAKEICFKLDPSGGGSKISIEAFHKFNKKSNFHEDEH